MTYAAPYPRISEVAKTGGLLAAIVLHNLIYPLSTAGGIWPGLFYLLYAGMFVVAAWLLTADPVWRGLATATGAAVFAAGMVNSFAHSSVAALLVYTTSIAYHAVIIVVLAHYTFGSRKVLTEVLLAATCLYLIIGSIFAAIFGLIMWLEPGAFVSSLGQPVEWQRLLYHSYITMTTVGYGDILPATFYAQAFAAFEAIIGTLYSVLLLSRLVGMHASRET